MASLGKRSWYWVLSLGAALVPPQELPPPHVEASASTQRTSYPYKSRFETLVCLLSFNYPLPDPARHMLNTLSSLPGGHLLCLHLPLYVVQLLRHIL